MNENENYPEYLTFTQLFRRILFSMLLQVTFTYWTLCCISSHKSLIIDLLVTAGVITWTVNLYHALDKWRTP